MHFSEPFDSEDIIMKMTQHVFWFWWYPIFNRTTLWKGFFTDNYNVMLDGMVWYDMVWYDIVWYETIRCDMMMWYGTRYLR